ncbi:MAG: tetratricopeptide repeat protein, partial [Pseudomonadales bacterium]
VHRRVLERQLEKNGRYDRDTGDSYQNLAGAITKQGRYDESIPLHRAAYDIYKKVLNDKHYLIALPLLSLSYANLMRGEGPAAELSSREALERLRATMPGTPLEGVAQCLVGLSLEQQGRTGEGAAMVDSSHDLMVRGSLPDPYPVLCRVPGQ